MKKFLVLYRMDMAEMRKMMETTSQEDRERSMAEWRAWMEAHSGSFADAGAPLGKTKHATATGVVDTRNDIGGYSIVEAENHEAAAALLTDSPHLKMPGAIAEVMEILPMS
jgi:hypothetical protein